MVKTSCRGRKRIPKDEKDFCLNKRAKFPPHFYKPNSGGHKVVKTWGIVDQLSLYRQLGFELKPKEEK
jgi:hypothetical protein